MNIVINEELKQYIDFFIFNEYVVLECSLLVEGCCDVLVLWGDVFIDGYNCYEICSKYDLFFKMIQNDSFGLLEDVLFWMIDNQLGCCSVLDFQCGMLVLCKCDIIVVCIKVEVMLVKNISIEENEGVVVSEVIVVSDDFWYVDDNIGCIKICEDIVCVVGISSVIIGQIDCICKMVVFELVEVVCNGVIFINVVVVVVILFSEVQVSVVVGGKKELCEVVKKVCEQKVVICILCVFKFDEVIMENVILLVEGQENEFMVILCCEIVVLQLCVSCLLEENQGLCVELVLFKGVVLQQD